MALTLFVSSVFLALVVSARPLNSNGPNDVKGPLAAVYKRERVDSAAARAAVAAIIPSVSARTSSTLSRRLKDSNVRLLLSPASSHEELLSTIGLGEDALRALVSLDKGTPVDEKEIEALLDQAGLGVDAKGQAGKAKGLNDLEGYVPTSPELLKTELLAGQAQANLIQAQDRNATESATKPLAEPLSPASTKLGPMAQFQAITGLPALPLLLSFTASLALLGLVSAGLWAHAALRKAMNPEFGFEKVDLLEEDEEDEDAQEVNLEKLGEKLGGGREKYDIPSPGLGLTFPREKVASTFGVEAPPPAYNGLEQSEEDVAQLPTVPLAPVPFPATRSRQLGGFESSLVAAPSSTAELQVDEEDLDRTPTATPVSTLGPAAAQTIKASSPQQPRRSPLPAWSARALEAVSVPPSTSTSSSTTASEAVAFPSAPTAAPAPAPKAKPFVPTSMLTPAWIAEDDDGPQAPGALLLSSPTPVFPTLPSVPTHAPVERTSSPAPPATELVRALLGAADVADPAWLLRILVVMLGWAFAQSASASVNVSEVERGVNVEQPKRERRRRAMVEV